MSDSRGLFGLRAFRLAPAVSPDTFQDGSAVRVCSRFLPSYAGGSDRDKPRLCPGTPRNAVTRSLLLLRNLLIAAWELRFGQIGRLIFGQDERAAGVGEHR